VAKAVTPLPSTDVTKTISSGDARVVVKALSDECWIQVRESDGQLVMSKLLHQGEVYQVPDRSGLTLTAGNAGSLQIIVDGTVVPSLGEPKQVKRDISLDPAKLLKKIKAETDKSDLVTNAPAPADAVTTESAKPETKKAEKKVEKKVEKKSSSDTPKSDVPKSDKPKKADKPKVDAPAETPAPTSAPAAPAAN
jgi:hypothetical protein